MKKVERGRGREEKIEKEKKVRQIRKKANKRKITSTIYIRW
jgi:hypothetical protein